MRLQIVRTMYPSGIGILANSRLEVRNDGYRHFAAMVGMDDSATDKMSAVIFTVYGDGKRLAQSPPMKWGAAAQPIDVNVAGVKLIELVSRSTGKETKRFQSHGEKPR
jgi:hypothetical protein